MAKWEKEHYVLASEIIVGIIILVFIVPLIINSSYQSRGIINSLVYNHYYTEWNAGDLLGYYGDVLAFIGTISLGALALWQNKKISYISEKQLKIEEIKQRPIIDYKHVYSKDKSKTFIELYNDKEEITVRVYLKNIGDGAAKKCVLKNAELFFENNYYLLNKENESDLFRNRAILSKDFFHFHFQCKKGNDNIKMEKMNLFFKNQSPITLNGRKEIKGMYVLELTIEMISLNNLYYQQKLWCLFKQNHVHPEEYDMWNRMIRFEENIMN